MHLLGRYYRQVEAGRKTIEARVATPHKCAVTVGDTVVFRDRDTGPEPDVIVKRVAAYHSFEDLLSSEDTCVSDGPHGELPANLRSIYPLPVQGPPTAQAATDEVWGSQAGRVGLRCWPLQSPLRFLRRRADSSSLCSLLSRVGSRSKS